MAEGHLSVHIDICRQNQPIQSELEGPNSGDMGDSDSDGRLPHLPHVCPQPMLPSPQPSPVLRGYYNIGRGDTVSPAETGHLSNPNSSRGILLEHVHSAQERWGSGTCHQPKAFKQTCESEHFKMEGLHTDKALLRRDDWMVKVDLKDAFLMVPIASQF